MKKENLEEILQDLMRQNLRCELAIEDCELDTNYSSNLLVENLKRLSFWRKNRKDWSIEKQIQEANVIQENFQKIIEEIGKEHFIFYDDGCINYIWQNIKKKEENK